MYNTIMNPRTNRLVNANSKQGQQIINNYLTLFQSGGVNPHTNKEWSSYNCKGLSEDDCVDEGTKCMWIDKTDKKKGHCKKRQNATRKRGQKNWGLLQNNLDNAVLNSARAMPSWQRNLKKKLASDELIFKLQEMGTEEESVAAVEAAKLYEEFLAKREAGMEAEIEETRRRLEEVGWAEDGRRRAYEAHLSEYEKECDIDWRSEREFEALMWLRGTNSGLAPPDSAAAKLYKKLLVKQTGTAPAFHDQPEAFAVTAAKLYKELEDRNLVPAAILNMGAGCSPN